MMNILTGVSNELYQMIIKIKTVHANRNLEFGIKMVIILFVKTLLVSSSIFGRCSIENVVTCDDRLEKKYKFSIVFQKDSDYQGLLRKEKYSHLFCISMLTYGTSSFQVIVQLKRASEFFYIALD